MRRYYYVDTQPARTIQNATWQPGKQGCYSEPNTCACLPAARVMRLAEPPHALIRGENYAEVTDRNCNHRQFGAYD